MKHFLLCLFSVLLLTNLKAQTNLVPNYSFETYTNCPTLINCPPPNPWYMPTSKINPVGAYLNACDVVSCTSVPYNCLGITSFQYARTGQAYNLISCYGGNNTNRFYVQTKLNDSLKYGKYYYAEFFVSVCNPDIYACNNVSLYFSKKAVYVDTLVDELGVIPANAQIFNYGNPILEDTMNWIKVSGIFKAQGGEQFITVGNFKNDSLTNITTISPSLIGIGVPGTELYLDNVSVIPLDSFNLKADAGRDTTIHIGDSAFIGSLTNGIDSIKWQVLNTYGTIDSIRPGFWVHPTINICYVLIQTVNGFTSSDTVCVNVLPLPLKFLKYEVRITNGSGQFPTNGGVSSGFVENLWATANEINVSHFYVQRSLNGKDFTTIGKVKANGASDNEYSFEDTSLRFMVRWFIIGL